MEIKVQDGDILQAESDLAVLATFEDAPLPAEVAGLLEPNDFRGRANKPCCSTHAARSLPAACCWSAWASARKRPPRRSGARARPPSKKPRNSRWPRLTVGVHGDLPLAPNQPPRRLPRGWSWARIASGATAPALSDEQTFKVERATVFSTTDETHRAGVAAGQTIARGVNFRPRPGQRPRLRHAPRRAGRGGRQARPAPGLKVTVLDMAQLIEQGFGGILAVGKGSDHEPRFIVMEYGEAQEGTPTICLVGKGLTFDSGGLRSSRPKRWRR